MKNPENIDLLHTHTHTHTLCLRDKKINCRLFLLYKNIKVNLYKICRVQILAPPNLVRFLGMYIFDTS